MFFSKAALVAASLSLTANAHLFLSSPSPISGSAPKDPLESSGANFPCHGIQLPSSGGMKMAAGSQQLLAFDTGAAPDQYGPNTAVHGGGSCQISITYETDPSRVKDPKNWKVIHSIEGGCPTNSFGNLDSNYEGPNGGYTGAHPCTWEGANGVDCVNTFDFKIPKGVKDGHAIMAWTWYNTIGNRELYMNCINTQITGGDGSEMDEFPSMFLANMGIDGGQCPTVEQQHVKFPYPGKYVEEKLAPEAAAKYVVKTYPIVQPTGAGCAENGAPAGGAAGGSSLSAAPPAPSAPAKGGAGSGSSSQASGGGMVTVTTRKTVTGGGASSGPPPSSAAPSQPVPYSAAPSQPAPSFAAPSQPAQSSAAPSAPASPPGTSSSGGCSNGKVSCPNPGEVVCIGDAQFGICDIDNCAVPQALAAGTHCMNGTIGKRSHVRHVHRHGAHRHVL